MAKKPTLKVFRTAIGFHDAYVAAPSQKAALEAWGSSRNLFASGSAEVVTDPKLTPAALAQPGSVLKVSRGTPAEQIAAVGMAGPTHNASARKSPKPEVVKRRQGPRPSRAALDKALDLMTELDARHKSVEASLGHEAAALEKKRALLKRAHARETDRATEKRDKAQSAYDSALATWKSGGS